MTPKPGIPLTEPQTEECPECGTPCYVVRHKLHAHYRPIREARGIPPAEEFVANAGLSCCPHTEPAALSEHKDDSYGGCVVCREYVAHTDDETRLVPWPCAAVRLAQGIPPPGVEFDYDTEKGPTTQQVADSRFLEREREPDFTDCSHAEGCICIEVEHANCCGTLRPKVLAEARGIPLIDVELLARALAIEALGDDNRYALQSDGTPYPADVEWAGRVAAVYARLASESSPVEEGDRP